MICTTERCWKVGVGREGLRESNRGDWLTKIKYIHNWDILRNPFKYWLWNYKWKTGLYNEYSVWEVLLGGKRVNGRNKGKGIWLMGFRYIHETEWWNFLQLPKVGQEGNCQMGRGNGGGNLIGTPNTFNIC
jgi:hypothetical protein